MCLLLFILPSCRGIGYSYLDPSATTMPRTFWICVIQIQLIHLGSKLANWQVFWQLRLHRERTAKEHQCWATGRACVN